MWLTEKIENIQKYHQNNKYIQKKQKYVFLSEWLRRAVGHNVQKPQSHRRCRRFPRCQVLDRFQPPPLNRGSLSTRTNVLLSPQQTKMWFIIYIYTSSAAQGGGGSFKNRKPIGEIGCCESGMAERSHWWTERCLRSPLFLSFSLCFSIFLWLSTYLPT